jgi:hypothetical protein
MSDIFYSQVDANLENELNLRGRAGTYNRTTNDLQFMLEKTANVIITPYSDPERTTILEAGILGGTRIRTGEYLPTGPDGFVSTRAYKVSETKIEDNTIKHGTAVPKTNNSRRTPPYVTSCDISIADSSNGLLNNATVNMIIPNPERDLNFIESVYFRPGRHVNIRIEHPVSAIVGETQFLTADTMPSTAKLQEMYPGITKDQELQYSKLNAVTFDGLITSFTIDFNTDMSVNASISVTGTTNIYTDLNMVINSVDATNGQPGVGVLLNTVPNTPTPNLLGSTTGFSITILAAEQTKRLEAEKAAKLAAALPGTIFKSFYSELEKEVQNFIDNKENGTPRLSDEQLGYTERYYNLQDITQGEDVWAVWGVTLNGTNSERYITLSWLIDFINRLVITKAKGIAPDARIICTSLNELIVSNYYEYLVSSDPHRIYIPWKKYGGKSWFTGKWAKFNREADPTFSNTATKQSFPTAIFINLKVIQENIKMLETSDTFTLSTFLSAISAEIAAATSNAINMNLITHPEVQNALLFFDANFIKTISPEKPVEPYSVPMFANHLHGTVVRDFKFSGKLPSDASNLAYVVNQDPGQIAESDIAPYVAYMYSANTVQRVGNDEIIGNLITSEELQRIQDIYKTNHKNFLDQYKQAITNFGLQPTNIEVQTALSQALSKYIQYPLPTIQESNQLAAPVIPFDVEFTIDGINGFRYGNILTFDALPTRYKQNAVFSIVQVSHTVGTDNQWTTTIRCIMRPSID